MAKNDPPPARKRKALLAPEPEVELEPVVYEAEFVEPETALVPVINISSMQAKINKLVGVQTYEVPTKCWLDTGFPDLNRALGSPEYGIPFGKMIELAGVEHSGKTLLATYLAGLAQQDGAAVGYIDLENSADDLWAGKLGLDMSQVMLISPKLVKPVNKSKEPWTLEGAEDMFYQAELSMSMFAQAGFKFQAWIVDSIANMQTRMSVEAGATKANMRTRMDRSLFLSENLPRWAGLCANYNAMVIFVNQLRNKVGLVFGDPEYSPGGRAVAHNCSIRARLRRIKNGKILGPDGTVIGLSATVANYKNKAGQGSNQEGKTAFRAKWNNAQIAMSVMTVKDAKEEDDE